MNRNELTTLLRVILIRLAAIERVRTYRACRYAKKERRTLVRGHGSLQFKVRYEAEAFHVRCLRSF